MLPWRQVPRGVPGPPRARLHLLAGAAAAAAPHLAGLAAARGQVQRQHRVLRRAQPGNKGDMLDKFRHVSDVWQCSDWRVQYSDSSSIGLFG